MAGFLNARIEETGKTRLQQGDRRFARVTTARYLWEAFREIGMASSQGGPISYTELRSFGEIYEFPLDSRDLMILRKMSKAYLRGLGEGEDAFAYFPRKE